MRTDGTGGAAHRSARNLEEYRQLRAFCPSGRAPATRSSRVECSPTHKPMPIGRDGAAARRRE